MEWRTTLAAAVAGALIAGAAHPPAGRAAASKQYGAPGAPGFLGRPDAPVLASLEGADVAEVTCGRGGMSLGFRVRLADGTRAYFKPAQVSHATNWNAEVAAYHLDRELGLGRVAPSVGRRLPYARLRGAARGDRRVGRLEPDRDGMLRGAMIAWVTGLRRLPLDPGWEHWLRVDGTVPAATPFRRQPGFWAAVRRAPGRRPAGPDAPQPDVPERPAELSDMIVFDYLAHNVDRWGGDNTNVRTVGAGGPLMYLDNGAAFTLFRPRVRVMDRRLAEVQRLRRSTVDAVRAFDPGRFARRLEGDPLAPLLDARQLANLEVRRRYLLEHVDALVARHGAEAVYAW